MRTRNVWVCLVSCWLVAGQQPDCTAESNGYYYDLSPLQAKQDYELKSDTGRMFKLNVCTSVVSETWKLDDPLTIGAYYRGPHGDVSIGTVNKTLRIVDSHPLLILSDGSYCGEQSSSLRASSVIRFICDNDVFGAGSPQLIAQLPPDDETSCAFFFEWRTHVACPTSKPSRIGGIIAIISAIAIILFLSYLIIGVTYRRFALGYRGFDQLPRISLIPFSSIPQLLEDAMDWFRDIRDNIRGGVRDLWPRSSAGGARSRWGPRRSDGFAPLAREEQEAMFRDNPDTPDGRFSLEDGVDREGARELADTSPSIPPKDSDKPGAMPFRL